ncbi:hypothetical protein AB0D59_18285 [Streptomyces sp. NPDC048417]
MEAEQQRPTGPKLPYLPLVNGARGPVLHTGVRSQILQTLD